MPRSGTLFDLCPSTLSPVAGKAFLLATLSVEKPQHHILDHLRSIASQWELSDSSFFFKLLAIAESNHAISSSITAPDNMYWHQVELARDSHIPATFERAKGLLFAALELQQLDVFALTSDYLKRLSIQDQNRFKQIPYLQSVWAEIVQDGDNIPHDWCEWVKLLPKMTLPQTVDIAERAVTEWPIDNYLHNDNLQQLIDALNSVPVTYQDQLLTALPFLVRWIQNDVKWPNPAYQPLYSLLFDYLLMSEDRSIVTYQAINQIFEGMLAMGSSPAIYTHVLQDMGNALDRLKGAKLIDWLIDLAELTIAYSCPDNEARLLFFNQIVQAIIQFGPRLTSIQHSILEEIAQILDYSEVLTSLPRLKETMSVSTIQLPKRFLIGIYTLVEQVGRFVAQHIEHMYPSIQVRVNTDKVNSPQLKELAQRADLMVVCWATAKHAATIAIGQERPKEKATIFPQGSGTSSVLRDIIGHLQRM